MTIHPGLAYRDADASHAIIQVFASGDIRDRLLAQNIDLDDIRAVDIDFKQLTPPELDAMGVLAIPEQVEFNDVVGDYVAERLARLCDLVKLNVNAAIASGTPHLVDTMVWSTHFSIAEAHFGVGIDGMGKLNSIVSAEGQLSAEQLQDLVFDITTLLRRAALPLVLRAVPRPPFIAGSAT